MNLGKIALDSGHYAGANVEPICPSYSEGNEMLKLGLMLHSAIPNSMVTRTDGKDVTFPERSYRAAQAKCDTLISLHSNYPADGVVVFYSITKSNDKAIAETIGRNIANTLGINFHGAEVRQSTHGYYDYYGMIRQPIAQGISHVFIVEHGSHKQLCVDTQHKLEIITQTYKNLFINNQNNIQEGVSTMLLKRGMTNPDVKQLQINLNRLNFNCGTPDSIFGTGTQTAVTNFQKANGLTGDGLAGDITLNKITALIKALDDKIAQDKIQQEQQAQTKSNDNLKAQVIASNQQIVILTAKIQAAINSLK